jgi:parallel beta-helix repeat protein
LKRFLLTLLFVGFAANASGATRYVDNSGSPACSNDPSFGSEAQPWCTINYGLSRISGGDDLVVKQGTYNEAVFINGPAGSPSKNTVIKTFPGHVVTIRGAGNTGRVKITGTSYLTFDGFVITNFNQGLWVEGASHHVVIQNCAVHDVGQDAIDVRQNSSFVTVQGCTIYNTERLGGCCNGEGIYIGSGSVDPQLDNTNNVTIRNNIIHDTTDEGVELKPGTFNCLVDGNTIFNVADLGPDVGAIEVNQRDLGTQTWTGNPGHIIRNNVIHDAGTGIRLGTGSTAYNNVLYNILGARHGIYVDNLNGDGFSRYVYHNTVHMTSNAVTVAGGTANVRNNIGPTTANNLAFNATYVVSAAAHDYHLVLGSAPIDAGIDLSGVVAVDKDGKSRGTNPDLGAYEFGARPSSPQNLRIVR